MRCPNCDKEIAEGKRLCSYCGHRLATELSAAPAPASDSNSTHIASSWKWVVGIGAAVVVAVGLVIALASRGKSVVPPTSTPEVFDSPLSAPMPTSTLGAFVSPLSTPTPKPAVLSSDDFSDTKSGWYEGSFGDREYRYEKGEYVILVKKNDLAAWASWSKEEFTDFALEADVRLVEGPAVAEMGLVFRLREKGNFYFFRINDQGQYIVSKNVNGEWQKVAGMSGLVTSPYIKTGGATNRLKVVCRGPQIALYVNDHHLTTVSDDSFSEGKIGLIAASIEYPEPVKVAFDNLVVSVVDDMP